jgi:hypothetical protein
VERDELPYFKNLEGYQQSASRVFSTLIVPGGTATESESTIVKPVASRSPVSLERLCQENRVVPTMKRDGNAVRALSDGD